MSIYKQLYSVFYPRSIALAGISLSNPNHWSVAFLHGITNAGFKGQLYLINPKGGQINGRKVYKSLAEIPAEVEYVISLVSAAAAPGLMRECAQKGVKIVHLYTSGFAETGEAQGIELQSELVRIARETGIRIIGPNCMGVYCPESGISFDTRFPLESGTVGVISQSGVNANELTRRAMWRGIRFSKVISLGNACDLNETDFLEYLTEDPKTRIIAMYLEGVKDGKRFQMALKRATREKTVILFKGGLTRGGAQATQGHTGSIAGTKTTWDALCRQYGLIKVNNIEQLANILVTLQYFPLPEGRNAVLLGGGGGPSVTITDVFEERGLKVPPLPQDIKDRIRSFTPVAGNILRNSIDCAEYFVEIDKLKETVNIVTRWKASDFLVIFLNASMPTLNKETLPGIMEEIHRIAGSNNKPMALILVSSIPDVAATMFEANQKIAAKGIALYQTFEDAARSIDLVLKHHHI